MKLMFLLSVNKVIVYVSLWSYSSSLYLRLPGDNLIRSTIGYLLCIINKNKIILVSVTNLFENLFRLFEAFYDSLKPSHARASNSHFRLQIAKVGSQTSDNALQNHFNVIIRLVIYQSGYCRLDIDRDIIKQAHLHGLC